MRSYAGEVLGFGWGSAAGWSWERWSGSPALVARIADQLCYLARQDPGGCEFRIELRVQDDVEFFAEPEAFRRNVSPESLRQFRWLGIGVNGPLLDVQFVLRRMNWTTKFDLRPLLERVNVSTRWTEREFALDRGRRLGGAWYLWPDAAHLYIESRDESVDVGPLLQDLVRILERGAPSPGSRLTRLVAPYALPLVTLNSLAYLFEPRWAWLEHLGRSVRTDWSAGWDFWHVRYWQHVLRVDLGRDGLVLTAVNLALAACSTLAVRLILPVSEIAEPGQTRARQLLRFAGQVATALLIATLTKVALRS